MPNSSELVPGGNLPGEGDGRDGRREDEGGEGGDGDGRAGGVEGADCRGGAGWVGRAGGRPCGRMGPPLCCPP